MLPFLLFFLLFKAIQDLDCKIAPATSKHKHPRWYVVSRVNILILMAFLLSILKCSESKQLQDKSLAPLLEDLQRYEKLREEYQNTKG